MEKSEAIKDKIDGSDFYVLIIAHRYGAIIESGEDKGISYIDYFNDKKKEEMDKMKNGMTINVGDNAVVYATQSNGVSEDELDKIVKNIIDNLKNLDMEEANQIVDVVEMAREELARPEPRPGRLRNCLSLIAPMIAVANGIPVLADNLQKFAEYIQLLVK